MKEWESDFKRTISKNKYQFELQTLLQNRYLNYLIDPGFQGVNRLFVLSFGSETDREVHTKYYTRHVEIKDYNVIINGKCFLVSRKSFKNI